MKRLLQSAAALHLLFGEPLLAADQPVPTGGTAPLPGIEGLLTTIGGLIFILALIFGAAWLLKRVGHLPSGGKGLVKILGGVSLSARERVVVVEVENARLVLGVSPGRVQTLHVMPVQSGFERSLAEAREAPQ